MAPTKNEVEVVEVVRSVEDDSRAEEIMSKMDRIGKLRYELSRPIKVADKTYTELFLDFDKLTGEDMEAAASMPGVNDGGMHINEFSKRYLMGIAAKAAGINIHELKKFPIADCTALTLKAQGFLMGAVSKVM